MPGIKTTADRRPSSSTRRQKSPKPSASASISSPTESGETRHPKVTASSKGTLTSKSAAKVASNVDRTVTTSPSDANFSTNPRSFGEEVVGMTKKHAVKTNSSMDPPTWKPTRTAPAQADGSPGIAKHSPTSSQRLNEYRERLARDLERRDTSTQPHQSDALPERGRVSPIVEEGVKLRSEATSNSSPLLSSSVMTSTSTESGNTIRGGLTPAHPLNTPSYPFPRMRTPYQMPSNIHRPFTALSPTGAPRPAHLPYEPSDMQGSVLSTLSNPDSSVVFNPSGVSEHIHGLDFPVPNLYDLSLMLSAEPGLDAWWATVVRIMRTAYKAERVTLSVPADTSDIENVPWGQKATYNEHQEDEFSLIYMGGDNSAPNSADLTTLGDESLPPSTPLRPGIPSRHSYTSYEERKVTFSDDPQATIRRPSHLQRSRSYLPATRPSDDTHDETNPDRHALDKHALEDLEAFEAAEKRENIPRWELLTDARREGQGRVLPVLQALDFEADPLIDHQGVMRVLERGTAVALTRNYPYLAKDDSAEQPPPPPQPSITKRNSKKTKKQRTESISKLSSILTGSAAAPQTSGPSRARATSKSRKTPSQDRNAHTASMFDEDDPKPPTPVYEEYEQPLPSPWAQSPAPSPAVRTDTTENPFFTDAMVDEDSFNPGTTPEHYEPEGRPPEAIGVDNSWTVLHIPLSHVLLSKPLKLFKLDSDALDVRQAAGLTPEKDTTDRSKPDPVDSSYDGSREKKNSVPIAILSILSPVIPYPSNLRHSLQQLAPHMATSFSLCRHYSNLETELSGIKRRRPSTSGFGAVGPDGRPLASASLLGAENMASQSLGSITSPSDYSAVSKSATASPSGTPGWDQASLNSIVDRRAVASPLPLVTSEGYFASKQKAASQTSHASKDGSPGDRRLQRLSGNMAVQDGVEVKDLISHVEDGKRDGNKDRQEDSKREKHTMLHTYGADFASTFGSLPPNSTVSTRPQPVSMPSRSGSVTTADMPPPSDRLKGLILDSLPAHVFVALPQNGEIVWVNSRFLSYRGQTVNDLTIDPWGNIHPDDRDEYLAAWGHCLRTGEQFSRTVRIRRFDGAYRWFHARAVASKDKRGVIMQFLGSYMDIHDQHIAELKAARQEEIEVSEAKHKLLANLIPQIIFTATEEDGVTFANEQWLSYTGQSFDDSLGLGFLDFVHPEDLAKCRIPADQPPTPLGKKSRNESTPSGTKFMSSEASSTSTLHPGNPASVMSESSLRGVHQALSRNNSSSSSSVYEVPSADLFELARKGVIKVSTDANGRLSYTTEVRLRSKTGEYRWHLIRCVEIDTIDFGSGASSYFGSATDINDHKLLEAKLKEAMESKSRFLSNMSHEIRTPLIGISGMVSFLQDSVLNEEQRDYTNTIQTSANSLIMIINDILDLSKVDAGMMKLKYEWFHTRSLIEDVNELVSTMAIAKRLELNYLVEADVPAWVKGDKVRIRQVLLNVIGNAIKFTNEGEVFSRCKVVKSKQTKEEGSGIMLEFAITDTGRGFTREEAELIFKPFSQIDGSSTRQHGGSGLGLVISRQLVELHGGKMEGTAVPGKGSTFTFSARFSTPTAEDHPNRPASPAFTATAALRQILPERIVDGGSSIGSGASRAPMTSPKPHRSVETTSPSISELGRSSPAVTSTGSSNPSIHSGKSQLTDRTSITSVNTGLARFSEAAKASGQDLSQMRLEMPDGRHTSPSQSPAIGSLAARAEEFRPPIYSILIICPQHHSREATKAHIEMTLPKDVPHQLTTLSTAEEAEKLIAGDDPIKFTHIVINLPSPEAVMQLMGQIQRAQLNGNTQILVLLDTVQRQLVTKLAASTNQEKLLSDRTVTFIYKPVKPSRFAVIFDPDKIRDLSIDHNRSTAQQMLDSQKASYLEIEKLMGNKGYKVLLVEDNLVNQKVLTKYLKKIGVDVEVAVDGVECTEKVFSKPYKHYSLILCDLHMPRKDGYQACREVRQWEKVSQFPRMPIIALSANVMSDVQDKCMAAGFSDYVTKPVDFIDLSRAMAQFF